MALAIQAYIRKLDEVLKGKTKMELSTEENKTRLRAQRSAKNISDVIKDLFRSPPSYRTKVVVSWRSPGDKVNKKEAVHVIQFEEAFRPLSAHLDYRKYQATTCQLCKTEVPNSDKEMRGGFFFKKRKKKAFLYRHLELQFCKASKW